MLYLLAATITSSLLVIILKIVGIRGGNLAAAITINYIVGAIITLPLSPTGVHPAEIIDKPWFVMSMIVGASFMISLMVYAVSAARSGVAITTISGRVAMAIPVIFAFAVLGEEPTPIKLILLAAIFVSMWLILKQDAHRQKGAPAQSWLATAWLPLLVFLFNGLNDTMMQYSKRELMSDPADNMVFTGTMFVASAVTGLLYYFFENRCRIPAISSLTFRWGVLLGVVNSICCIGILFALERMDGSVFYPLYYAGAVVLSTIVGVWAFKEKLSAVNYAGMAIAVTAIVLLATV